MKEFIDFIGDLGFLGEGGGPRIALSNRTIAEDASVGALVGTLSVIGGTGTYAFMLTNDAGGKFALDGVDDTRLETAAALNYEAATSHAITISADNGVDPPISLNRIILVTNVLEVTLAALTLDSDTIPDASAPGVVVGAIQGASAGSTLALIDNAGNRFALSGTNIVAGLVATDFDVATEHNITLRETHTDAGNSPRDSVITITVTTDAWFVDSAVAVSGNGRSWATAWKQPTDIDWLSVEPGDTVYFSGGSVSKTYTGGLVVETDGDVGQPITLTKGTDAGHNGEVIHDGQNARICIETAGHDYIVIQDMSARNTNDTCIYVDTAAAGVIVQRMTVLASGPGGGNARGIDVRHCTGTLSAIVRDNIITTHVNSTDQTDCIYAQDNDVGSVRIHDNDITQLNADNTGHSDGIQLVDNGSLEIFNNRVEVVNGGADNHGIFTQNCRTGSVYLFYNNEIIMRGPTTSFALTHQNEAGFAGVGKAYNNSIAGGTRGINFFDTPAANEAKNNIIWPATGGIGFFIESATPPDAANIQNNLIYAPGATVGDVNGVAKDWAAWQLLGYDTAGLNENPLFVDPYYNPRIRDDSPAIDAGATIAAVTTDILGVARPAGGAYDMGAYEGGLSTAGFPDSDTGAGEYLQLFGVAP